MSTLLLVPLTPPRLLFVLIILLIAGGLQWRLHRFASYIVSFIMTILITGGRGLIGSALTKHWRAQGHRVLIASRSAKGEDFVKWDPTAGEIELSDIDSLDAVVHLAGENLADGRWTDAKKERILESRRWHTHGCEGDRWAGFKARK